MPEGNLTRLRGEYLALWRFYESLVGCEAIDFVQGLDFNCSDFFLDVTVVARVHRPLTLFSGPPHFLSVAGGFDLKSPEPNLIQCLPPPLNGAFRRLQVPLFFFFFSFSFLFFYLFSFSF